MFGTREVGNLGPLVQQDRPSSWHGLDERGFPRPRSSIIERLGRSDHARMEPGYL